MRHWEIQIVNHKCPQRMKVMGVAFCNNYLLTAPPRECTYRNCPLKVKDPNLDFWGNKIDDVWNDHE